MKPLTKLTSQQHLLICVGGVGLLALAGGYAYWIDKITVRRPVYLLQDGSESSEAMAALKAQMCPITSKQLTVGDQWIYGEFTTRLELISSEVVNNPNILSCKREMPAGYPVLQVSEPGTRLEETLGMLLDETRKSKHRCPVVLMTLHATDSNDGKPVNWNNVRNQATTLVGKCGALVIFGPTGDLRHQFSQNLPERARVYPPLSVNEGITWAFSQARTQGATHE
jgi:hypothetical protein